jgi:hypothetical protein
LTDKGNEVFVSVAAVELQRLNDILQSMSRGTIAVEGSHSSIVRQLSTYLATLRGGSRYVATTIPKFWWPTNLGIHSRYLSENIELIRRGVIVERLLVLTPDDRADPLVHDIIRSHLEMEADCAQLKRENPHAGTVETRYMEMLAEDRVALLKRGEQRGIWITQDSAVSLIPTYDSNDVIKAVTLRRSEKDERDRLMREFDALFRSTNSHPLREWASA